MIILKSRDEIGRLKRSNRLAAQVMNMLAGLIKPGVTTAELDRKAEELIIKNGAKPAFKGYMGYKHTLCISTNEEVVHGIPGARALEEGDIVGIDCGVLLEEFYGDHAWSFPVGKVSDEAKKILAKGEEALMKGIAEATVDKRLYDISHAIQTVAETNGYSVVRDYVGHGIGTELHEEPQVPNFGEAGTGIRLRAGLTLALEPMLNQGSFDVEVLEDGWTVVTKDRKLSVHFEHSIAVTEEGPVVLSVMD
jgi:methionyl aminopeptidase